MENFSIDQLLYLVATAFFIVGIKRLSKVKTARSGNLLAAAGMALAIAVTLITPGAGIQLDWKVVAVGAIMGTLIGGVMAKKVEMTGMPEMVALFNGFGGLASTMVALSEFWGRNFVVGPSDNVILGNEVWVIAIILSVLVGTVTFTGSLVAMGKLSGKISGNPVILPGRHFIVAALLIGGAAMGVMAGFMQESYDPTAMILGLTA
ncbi:MAG: NAD synthetase, partial [Planctomycetes bacterium]|nr:NAD synthetase [Planctomycetota bacterium]